MTSPEVALADIDLSYFIKGTLSTGLGKLSTIVLGFVGLMITARCLAPEDLGAFVLFRVIVTFLTRSSDLGLHLSIPKFIASAEKGQQRRRIINTVIYFRLFTILAVIIIALVARRALFMLFDASLYSDLIVFIPILLTLESLGVLLIAILEGIFNFELIGVVNFISSLTSLIFTVMFISWFEQGILGLVYARIASMTIAYAWGYFSARFDHKLEFEIEVLKRMLIFAFPLHINYILTFIFTRIDTFIISALLGPAEVAFYEIARRIPDSLEQMYGAFREVYFPFISRLFALGKKDKVAIMLNHSTRLISFVSILGALVALVFGDKIVILLFSEIYLPSVPVFVLMMIGLTFTLIDYTLGYSLVAIGDSSKPPLINVGRTVVSFAGYFILIPKLGIAGAAFANLAGTVSVNPLNVLFLRRKRIDVKIGGYIKPILVSGACFFLILFLKPTSILQGILIVLLFILASVFLSIITQEDIATITSESQMILSRSTGRPRSDSTEV